MSVEARIHLEHLLSNYRNVKLHLSQKTGQKIDQKTKQNRTKVCVSVKANAYGHGLEQVVAYLSKHESIDYWGIATLEEGKAIRALGNKEAVLCYCQLMPHEIEEAITNSIELTVGDASYLRCIVKSANAANTRANAKTSTMAKKTGKKPKVHLMIETGMGRLGFMGDDVYSAYQQIIESQDIELCGICTHFLDSSSEHTLRGQLDIFNSVLDRLAPSKDLLVHVANSGAIVWYSDIAAFDMVRPGIMLYGGSPNPDRAPAAELGIKPAMTLVGRISSIQRYPKGQGISYMSNFVCPHDTNIAVVNIGYGDGLPRALGNKGLVSIHDTLYPIVGNVCMDMCMVNLGKDSFPINSEVVLFGNSLLTQDDQAKRASTISYTLTTQLTQRVAYLYE